MGGAYTFELLNSTHERAAFSCGEPSLDRYLLQQAGQDMRRHLAGVFVLHQAGDPRVIGYYTLSAASIALHTVSPDAAKRLGTYREVPATLLGRLAVDSAYGGRGFGRQLLLNALQRSMNSEIGSALVIVDAIDERAANFYARFGFEPLPSTERRLCIPMETIKKLLGPS